MDPVKIAALAYGRRCVLEAAHQRRKRSRALRRTRHANHFNRTSQTDDQINMTRWQTRVRAWILRKEIEDWR